MALLIGLERGLISIIATIQVAYKYFGLANSLIGYTNLFPTFHQTVTFHLFQIPEVLFRVVPKVKWHNSIQATDKSELQSVPLNLPRQHMVPCNRPIGFLTKDFLIKI